MVVDWPNLAFTNAVAYCSSEFPYPTESWIEPPPASSASGYQSPFACSCAIIWLLMLSQFSAYAGAAVCGGAVSTGGAAVVAAVVAFVVAAGAFVVAAGAVVDLVVAAGAVVVFVVAAGAVVSAAGVVAAVVSFTVVAEVTSAF